MAISNHDHPLHNILRADVVREAGERLNQGALALAMWLIDSVGGDIAAHVRVECDETGSAVRMQGLALYYHQFGSGFPTHWTRRGYFDSATLALNSIGRPFHSATDLIVRVDARNIAAFLQEVNLPKIDAKLFVEIVKLGKPVRNNAAEVVARMRADAGAPVDVRRHPFTDMQFVCRLLEGGATPEFREQLLWEAGDNIHLVKAAITLDRSDILGEMLDRGCAVDMVDKSDRSGSRLLHLAGDSPRVAGLLLTRGASVDCVDSEGGTPLHKARSVEVMRVLLAHGARLDVQDNGSELPLHRALRVSATLDDHAGRYVEPLLSAGADPFHVPDGAAPPYLTPFQTAVKNGWVEQAGFIVDRYRVDFAQRTVGGRTLIQLASKEPAMKDFLKAAKTGLVIENSVEGANEVSGVSAGCGAGRQCAPSPL